MSQCASSCTTFTKAANLEQKVEANMWKRSGIVVQILAFIVNVILWGMAIYAIIYGAVVGISSQTIRIDEFSILDFLVLTPATIFLFYGVPMLLCSTFGWFAIVSSHRITLFVYIEFLLLLTFYDQFFGFSFMTNGSAWKNFLWYIKHSLSTYGGSRYVGMIFGVTSTVYWDHLQERGQCCGWDDFEDWENHTMATSSDFLLPDTCCNSDYEYKGCGFLLWDHFDNEQHMMDDVVHDEGCKTLFPPVTRSDDGLFHLLGILFLLVVVTQIILSLALIILTTYGFKRHVGINNPSFIFAPAEPRLLAACKSSKLLPRLEDCCPTVCQRDEDDGLDRARNCAQIPQNEARNQTVENYNYVV